DRLALVDTGVPGSEGAIFALIESLGRDPSELKQVLITHADSDHVGSLAAVVGATGAEVCAGALEAEVIEGKRRTRGGQLVDTPVPVGCVVDEGDTLPIRGGVRVVETFGHTAGHVAYFVTGQGVLIAGDCLNNQEGFQGSKPEYTLDAA